MGDLTESLLSLNPIWVVMSIVVGLIIGYITKDIEIDKRTIQLLLLYYAPFALSRFIVIVIFGGTVLTSGLGYVGVILTIFYAVSIYIGRKVGHKSRGG